MKSPFFDYINWFLRFFDKGFKDFIDEKIKESQDKGLYSLEQLAHRYPEVKEYAIKAAKDKLKVQTNGLQVFKQSTATEQFTRFKAGVNLVKPLIEALANADFSPASLVTAVLKTFEAAVSSGGLIVYKFHDGEDTLEQYEVKDKTLKGGSSIEIAYIYLHVKSKKVGGWVFDDSLTTVTYKLKVAQYANFESLVRWLNDQ